MDRMTLYAVLKRNMVFFSVVVVAAGFLSV